MRICSTTNYAPHYATDHTSLQARALALNTPTGLDLTREPQADKRLSGRPCKNVPLLADLRTTDDGYVSPSIIAPRSAVTTSVDTPWIATSRMITNIREPHPQGLGPFPGYPVTGASRTSSLGPVPPSPSSA